MWPGAARELQQILGREDQAFVVEPALVRHPRHDGEVGRRSRAKARDPDVDRTVRAGAVDADGLDLEAEDAAGVQMPDRELDGFQVGKRPEQVQALGLRQNAGYLGLAQETERPAPERLGLGSDRQRRQAERHAESLDQTIRRGDPGRPAAFRPRLHAV